MAIGAIVVLVLNLILPPEAMDAWGWRVAFLLSFPLLAFGTYVRLRIGGETPEFKKSREAAKGVSTPMITIFRSIGGVWSTWLASDWVLPSAATLFSASS